MHLRTNLEHLFVDFFVQQMQRLELSRNLASRVSGPELSSLSPFCLFRGGTHNPPMRAGNIPCRRRVLGEAQEGAGGGRRKAAATEKHRQRPGPGARASRSGQRLRPARCTSRIEGGTIPPIGSQENARTQQQATAIRFLLFCLRFLLSFWRWLDTLPGGGVTYQHSTHQAARQGYNRPEPF